MFISIAICTRNRADQLGQVLDTVRLLKIPASLDWEIVLVDNGSTDHTAAVAARYAAQIPLRYVLEPTPGLSNARNRAVAEVRGDFLCWTDDDVRIDPDWLQSYHQAFLRHPDAAFFGGAIVPQFEGPQPPWFTENRESLAPLFAERDLGPEEVSFALEGHRLPFGANYAVRTSDQRRHRYDPELGVAPGQKRLGEEVELFFALLGEGAKGYWVPGARVQHIIPAQRLSLDYVKRYQEAAGETWAYLNKAQKNYNSMGIKLLPGGRCVLGAPLWVWRRTATNGLRYAIAQLTSSPAARVARLMRYHYYRGALCYYVRDRGNPTAARPSFS